VRIRSYLITVGIVLLAMACSSSPETSPTTSSPAPSPSPSPSPSPTYCDSAQAVKDSFNALITTDVLAEGTDTLKTRFATFTTDLAAFRTDAKSNFATEVDAVQGSVDQLKTVVDNADSAGAATTASQFVAGLVTLKTSMQTLITAIDDACGT
jgi:hypothetical protein